ncbi:MAG: RDD family protein [Bacilli bacterium]|nr:RDD family protein [Bacilli bacterium]
MKRLLYRLFAYGIDLLIINIVLIAISNISFINTNIGELQSTTTIYTEVSKEYKGLINRIDPILYDKYIDLSEATELKGEYQFFYQDLLDMPINSELTDEQIGEIKLRINNTMNTSISAYSYDISRLTLKINIIAIIIGILYFGVFEWYMHGKTIGKMIFRLKTVDNTSLKKKIPLWKYLVKSLLVSGVIFTLANIIITLICNGGDGSFGIYWFNSGYNLINDIQYIYNVLFLLVIFIRKDERSIHDVLLNIRVMLMDKNGKEIESTIFNEKLSN